MSDPFFHIISIGRNAERVVVPMLQSLQSQTFKNWELTLVDDCSTDDTRIRAYDFLEGFLENDWRLLTPSVRQHGIKSTLDGLDRCKSGQVAVFLDMDDYLLSNSALATVADTYKRKPVDVVWTEHRWINSDGWVTDMNISGPLPEGADPYVHPWVSSHLKTARMRLLLEIRDENFRGEDGEYFQRVADQAIMLPALKLSRGWEFLPFAAYGYRTPPWDDRDHEFQSREAEFLRKRGFLA